MFIKRKSQFLIGFSLIELVIVMAIIIILSGISFPLIREHLFLVRCERAKSELMYLAAKMEQYYSERHSYQDANLQKLNFTVNDSYYQFAIALANADKYIIKAIPKSAQKSDKCGTLILNQFGGY